MDIMQTVEASCALALNRDGFFDDVPFWREVQ